ncbi:MAG TPA: phosphate ABC transporter substrate-binding protein PstS [Chloroflexota bacterium]|nr:phosphate ABC transporter substrate-binding protein PstS [Chloroflexota bacterium]
MTQRSMSRRSLLLGVTGLTGLAVAMSACGGQTATPSQLAPTPAAASAAAPAQGTPSGAAGGQQILLNGAGSTFDNPLFSKAFSEYGTLHPNVKVNYQSIGSGAGIQQLTKSTVDFGATDAPMSDQQLQDAGGSILHIPITLGAVAIAYNLPGVAEGLKFTGAVLGDIYLGKITAWNDPVIVTLNPNQKLSNTPIAVVHRSDGSGTTDIFTTYLAKVSPAWKTSVGSGTSVNWPVGIGGKGSEGVSGQVKQTPGGIGYFELAYAKGNNLTSTAIDNGTGTYVLPTSDGASACAAGSAQSLPADLRVRIAGCSGESVYPISGFSWVILRQKQTDQARGAALVNLLWWLVHDGQSYSSALSYAPLPAPVVKRDEDKLRSVTFQGKPLLTAGQ